MLIGKQELLHSHSIERQLDLPTCVDLVDFDGRVGACLIVDDIEDHAVADAPNIDAVDLARKLHALGPAVDGGRQREGLVR